MKNSTRSYTNVTMFESISIKNCTQGRSYSYSEMIGLNTRLDTNVEGQKGDERQPDLYIAHACLSMGDKEYQNVIC